MINVKEQTDLMMAKYAKYDRRSKFVHENLMDSSNADVFVVRMIKPKHDINATTPIDLFLIDTRYRMGYMTLDGGFSLELADAKLYHVRGLDVLAKGLEYYPFPMALIKEIRILDYCLKGLCNSVVETEIKFNRGVK